jgi:hypothetical protein
VAPESEDLVVGTDITGKVTKNFTVGSIVSNEIPTYITGTTNSVPLFTGAKTIGNCIITQNATGDKISVNGSLNLSGPVTSSFSSDGLAGINLNVVDAAQGNIPDYFLISLESNGSGLFYAKNLELGDGEDAYGGALLTIDSTNSKFLFDNGNVGIGTATPGSKLDVNGNVTSTYNAADTNTGAYGINRTLSGLTVNARGYRDNTIITSPGNNAVSYAGVDLKSQSTNGTYEHVTMFQGRHSLDAANLTDFEGLYIGGLNFTNSSSATNYVGITVENPTLFNGSITNFIGTNIKAPARSGGTITNFYGLKIENNVSATNKWGVYSEDTSVKSKMLGQLESGDISVYNTGTSASLNLNSFSTGFGGNYIHAKKSDGSNQWVLGSNSGFNNQVVLKQYNDADIIFQNNSGDAVTIKSSGNVGIGTTSPNNKLEVAGNIRITESNYLNFGGAGSIPEWSIRAYNPGLQSNDLVIADVASVNAAVKFENGKGVVLPNKTTTEINAIISPDEGAMIYNTTLNTICFYNGSAWQKVSHTAM